MAFATVFPEFVARDPIGPGHQAQLQGVLPRPQPKDRGMEHAKRPAPCGWVGLGQGRDRASRSGGGNAKPRPPRPGVWQRRTKDHGL